MDNQELIEHARRIQARIPKASEYEGIKAEICEFFRVYAGPQSKFYTSAETIHGGEHYSLPRLTAILDAFVEYVQAGLLSDVSPERRAQLDVVSDILEQAETLLNTKSVHPAAAAVLIGATLEEFLRNWVEAENLALGELKPGLETYAKVLRAEDMINKQDMKDITSWAGTRNDAAHGKWDEVSDKNRIRLMLEGVNLFMRKYGM